MSLEDWLFWGGLLLVVAGLAASFLWRTKPYYAPLMAFGLTAQGVSGLLTKLTPFYVCYAVACFAAALYVIIASAWEEKRYAEQGVRKGQVDGIASEEAGD